MKDVKFFGTASLKPDVYFLLPENCLRLAGPDICNYKYLGIVTFYFSKTLATGKRRTVLSFSDAVLRGSER